MAYDEKTAERVRGVPFGRRDLVEKKMMGGICFMVSVMCCGVTGSALMVRVGREANQSVLAQPHVRPMEFAGRRASCWSTLEATAPTRRSRHGSSGASNSYRRSQRKSTA
jgi:hypothetical protein